MKKSIALCLLALVTQGLISTTVMAKQKPLKKELPMTTVPGFGYFSTFERSLGVNCFSNSNDPNRIRMTAPIGSIKLDTAISEKEMDSMLNVGGGLEAGYAGFSASVSANYKMEHSESRYKISLTYAQSSWADALYHVPDNSYGIGILNPLAKGAYEHNRFMELCGDSFVKQAHAGVVLLVSTDIQFASASDKTKFDSEFKAGYKGIASITANFAKASSSSNVDATLTLSAIQLGGEPIRLANIFGSPDSSGHYPVVACSPKDISKCQNIINAVIAYAQALPEQVKNPDTVYYWNPVTTKFRAYGLDNESDVPLTQETKKAISYLIDTKKDFDSTQDYLLRYTGNMKNILAHRMPTQLPAQVKTVLDAYKRMDDFFNQAYVSCFSIQANKLCVPYVNNLKQELAKNEQWIQQAKSLKTSISIVDSDQNGVTYSTNLVSLSTTNPVPNNKLPDTGVVITRGMGFGDGGSYVGIGRVAYQGPDVFSCKTGFNQKAGYISMVEDKNQKANWSRLYAPIVICHTSKTFSFAVGNLLNETSTDWANPVQTFYGSIRLHSTNEDGKQWYYFNPMLFNRPIIKGYDNLNFNPF